jgi:hypothetical protein
MSLVINTKTNTRKNGTKKTYHYVNVVFGEPGKANYEFYPCGNAENPQSYEKAINKIKAILERELYRRVEAAQKRANKYMSKFVVEHLDHTEETQLQHMVEESNHS